MDIDVAKQRRALWRPQKYFMATRSLEPARARGIVVSNHRWDGAVAMSADLAALVSWRRGDNGEALIEQEWLVTNGLGGYASGTVLGVPTRRYHGVFIPNLPAPRGRTVLVPRVDASIRIGPTTYHLNGADHVDEFKLVWQIPRWTFRVQDRVIEKRITMPNGQNTVYVRYALLEGEPLTLHLRPYFTCRGHDQPIATRSPAPLTFTTIAGHGHEAHWTDDAPVVRMKIFPNDASFVVDSRATHVLYRAEQQRGLDCEETISSPGEYNVTLKPGQPVAMIATTEPWDSITSGVDRIFEAEEHRLRTLLGRRPDVGSNALAAHLILAADQFLISPSNRVEEKVIAEASGDPIRTVVAGYHWFTDWGRDTMISLEGLTLCTGRYSESRAILRTFSTYVKNGLLPNLFPEGAQAGLYHTIDATFWFFHAVDRYYHYTQDRETLEALFPIFQSIIDWHVRGTGFGIGVDPKDGLLRGGAPGYALTWMDAKVEDTVVTPRRGKPVEIQALWYNALCLMDEWSKELQVDGTSYGTRAEHVKDSFNRRFWQEQRGHLFDVVDGDNGDDATFRPNQIFTMSFRFPLLLKGRWKPVFEAVTAKLLTPYGLRTLATDDPQYHPRYEGNRRQRDMAYHQGMVWAWLMGPYLDARRNVYPGAAVDKTLLEPFEAHLREAGIGTISEIFDGEKPYLPRGCIAQAWSVAEVRRHAMARI
jgi:predicted glycogen debranching enzyme